MIDRRLSCATERAASNRTISRREILRIGGMVIPASILLPKWMTANAQTVSTTFDFYVSPTGSDGNPGTVAAPWAITSLMNRSINANNQANFNKTSGKRIGFLPGTYNVSTQMQGDSFTGAFQIDGGTSGSPTYYGSCNSSGQYSLGTATITALTTGGLPGGGLSYPSNGPILGGLTNTPHNGGYVTIDGLRFTAFTYKAIRLGGVSSGDGPAITGDVLIQNCEFFGQFQQSGATTDNFACIWLDGTATVASGGTGNYVITNNYFHNNIGIASGGEQHLCAIFIFNCAGVQITYNTGVNCGSLAWGKDHANQGTTVAYNYIDTTALSAGPQLYGFSDFTGSFSGTTGLTLTSNFHHNIVVTNGWGFGLRGAAVNEAWETPLNIYNNTIVMSGSPYPAIWANARLGDTGHISIYNNIITGAADGSGYKHITTGALSPSLIDYNGEPSSTMSWRLIVLGDGNTTVASYTTASSFAAGVLSNGGISGCEAHSVSNNSPQFTGVNTGQLSTQYQLQAGSPFKGVGSTTGTPSGTACDMGAWGGASPPTQVGCNFSAPSTSPAVPMAPHLTVVS
jgi:hypothetical protein